MRPKRVDGNHKEICQALRDTGCDVLDLSAVGKGCPDLLISHPVTGYHLIEVKDGSKPASARQLNERQVKFHKEWKGPIHTVISVKEALDAVGLG